MPVIKSSYQAPRLFRNGYVQSIYPTLFRNLDLKNLGRQRLELDDGDFLDLDWAPVSQEQQTSRLVIVSHGLEGHSRRPYVLGTLRQANRHGCDALAWNFRSCSGENNRLPRMYHSGATEDLHRVVQEAVSRGYRQIHLVGYSMGGNLSLVYAGREKGIMPPEVKSVCAFSVPCDLRGSADELAKPRNRIFMWRFLRDLKVKVEVKAQLFPHLVTADDYQSIRDFQQFDDRYTAPLHGFDNALDYWARSSCLQFLPDISVPALLVNAADDPFLSASCYPREVADQHPLLQLEIPRSGGHVGFIQRSRDHTYWMEERAMAFIESLPDVSESDDF